MTYVRKSYVVTLWTGSQKPEQNGDRLVVLSWKGNSKTGRKAHSARCFSVPMFQPSCVPEYREYEEMLVDAFEGWQKKIAHEYVSGVLEKGENCLEIPAELLSKESVRKYFEAETGESEGSSRGKLSGEQIAGWFNAKMKDVIIAKVAEGKGWMEEGYELSEKELKVCEQAANGYRVVMEKLAAPSPKVEKKAAEALKKAIELVGSEEEIVNGDDGVAKKLWKKIDRILNPEVGGEEIGLEML